MCSGEQLMSSASVAEYDLSEILKAYRMKWEGHKTAEERYRLPSYKCPHCKDMGFVDLYPQNRAAHGETGTVIYCPYCQTNMLKDIFGIIAEYRDLDISKFPLAEDTEMSASGAERVFNCTICEKEYGECDSYPCTSEHNKRYLEWRKKENRHLTRCRIQLLICTLCNKLFYEALHII